ncbi:MAG: type II toxin-antitoxin system prevent-host-death family antitoxin [Verrucomicrobia bacterium]|jgi:prevent-host-death family protein|nr:type II toxin-antitoxin system prevent-host-death family antitoxin [Verrucomicrobiota bacterium]MDA1047021.1 type II toxin-antitoxin system prevent-host-death family antitoxin [Verrucomicrobiota bacterium]
MTLYTTHQAKTHLSRLLDEAESGGEVVIAKGKRPVVRLVPHSVKSKRPRPTVGESTSKAVKIVETREVQGKVGDTIVYF